MGIAFIDDLKPDEAVALLRLRREALQVALEAAQEAPLHEASFQLVIEHQRRHLAFELEWLDKLITQLGENSPLPG